MTKIENTLRKIRDKIKPLLLEMYPDLSEAIESHYQENFNEWFGMLFKLHEWEVKAGIVNIDELVMSQSKTAEVREELLDYEGLSDYGYISVVFLEGEYHLIDGYHRVLIARENEITHLKACIWEKVPNNHENCNKIKQLIIKNL